MGGSLSRTDGYSRPAQRALMLYTKREEYLLFRSAFAPEPVKLVIIAESPPNSGLYFYDPDGRITEPLFAKLLQT